MRRVGTCQNCQRANCFLLFLIFFGEHTRLCLLNGLHIMHEHKASQSNFWLIAVGAKTMDSHYGVFFLHFGRLRSKSASECKYKWWERSCDSHSFGTHTSTAAEKPFVSIGTSLFAHTFSFIQYVSSRFVSLHPFPLQFLFPDFFLSSVVWKLNSYFAVQQQLTVTLLPIRHVCVCCSAYR